MIPPSLPLAIMVIGGLMVIPLLMIAEFIRWSRQDAESMGYRVRR